MGSFADTGCVLATDNRAAGDFYLLLKMHIRCSQCSCAVAADSSFSVLIRGI